ncbi:MAG: hypothetical protein JJ896_09625 [Rhodothermales bacterium]|nr:hypothetical protein [Rhodothermales bacterium]MBO6779898.1 hypothetical protein [Rhodothermales bacterium]
MSDRDVAVDCLADAFRRDASGALPEFIAYFDQHDWRSWEEEQVFTAFRQFVFRKTLDGVYRMHGERDPQLARLIRNLKLTIAESAEVVLYKKGQVAWIRTSEAPVENALEPIPLELFERRVCVCEGDTAPDLLACTVRVLRHQTLFAPSVPLTGLAIALRNALARTRPVSGEAQEPTAYSNLSADWVRDVIRAVSSRMWPSYQGKVSRPVYEAYQEAAFLVVVRGYCHSAAVASTLHLTAKEYRERHRNTFEYVLRQFRRRLRAEYLADLSAERAG